MKVISVGVSPTDIINKKCIFDVKISNNMGENEKMSFLSNSPIGKDLFEGKSQEKIADVVVKILNNKKFQIIGIDGSWGTGKSNLVGIVNNKLEHHKFFIYDVWGHQEDDQRKAILIELTEFISDQNIVSNKQKWTNKLKKLLSKEKEVTTINRPYLSVGFIFSLFSIIYVPSVNVFKDSMVDFLKIEKTFWKLVLVLLPIFIVIGIYIWNLARNWFFDCNGFWKSFKLASQETFQVYTNKQQEETKTETISENEPSVKDFRDWMKEIDTDLNKNKLILVFDNFDRLPKKHILSIWSSIHIFFSEDKYENIKVIIPFDRLHIKNAFKELNSDENSDYANDYINKTFDLVYRVSPPILSNWKTYFKERWLEAFTHIDEEEYLKVLQIYDVFRKTITPREIIAFINEVVSIKLLDDNIPDRYIALFVLNKEIILNDPLKAITGSEFLEGLSYLYKDDEDFQKYITALAYQIKPENALEVVYRKQLKDCLINNKSDGFIEISKTSIFSKIIIPVLSEIDDYENPILICNSLDEDASISSAEKQQIWNNIYQKIKNKDIVDFKLKDYQKILLIHILDLDKKKWLDFLIKCYVNHPNFDPIEYAKIVDDISEIINSTSISIEINQSLIEKTIPADRFIALVKEKEYNFIDYKIECRESELNKYLIDNYKNEIDELDYIEYLFNHNYSLFNFRSAVETEIKENNNNKEYIPKLFKILKYKKWPTLKRLLSDEQIYNLFNQTNSEEDFYYDLIAMRLEFGIEFNESYAQVFFNLLDSEDSNIINKVSERITYYANYGDFLLNSTVFKDSKLYQGVAKNFIEYRKTKSATVKKILPEFEDICNANQLNSQELINDLSRWDISYLTEEFCKTLPNFYFEASMVNNTQLAKTSIELITKSYSTLSKEGWIDIFSDLNGKDAKLLKIIKYKEWNSYSIEALQEHLIKIVKSQNLENKKVLNDFIESFENAGTDLNNTFKNVRDEFISTRNINDELFLFFGPWLFKYASLKEQASNVTRTIFKASLLDNEECLNMLLEKSENLKELISKSSLSDVSDFKAGIKDRIGNEHISILSNKVGLVFNKDKK